MESSRVASAAEQLPPKVVLSGLTLNSLVTVCEESKGSAPRPPAPGVSRQWLHGPSTGTKPEGETQVHSEKTAGCRRFLVLLAAFPGSHRCRRGRPPSLKATPGPWPRGDCYLQGQAESPEHLVDTQESPPSQG